MSDIWFHPEFDAAAFRKAVARYIKLLIRARCRDSTAFVSEEELKRWGLKNIDQEPMQPWQLLLEAANALAKLNTEYIPVGDSGGIPMMECSENQPIIRLIEQIAFFVPPLGGSPYHNQVLVQAASELQQGNTLDWEKLAEWQQLAAIRDDLDRLPNSSLLRREATPPTAQAVFPVSVDVGWNGVTIDFVSNDSFRISAGKSTKILMYSEAGFKDGRRGNRPDSKWDLLRRFARHNGRIDWDTVGKDKYGNADQAAISEIRRRLRALTGLTDDPFHNYRESPSKPIDW